MDQEAVPWRWHADEEVDEWVGPSGAAPAARPRRVVELPDVEEVVPGLWSVPVPMPRNPLGYTLVYAFDCGEDIVLVDAGMEGDAGLQGLTSGLGQVGARLSDVRGVLVTHGHPDHYGLAGAVREASGAWVALHPADAAHIPESTKDGTAMLAWFGSWLRETGAPADAIHEMLTTTERFLATACLHQPDLLMEGGQRVDAPGWELTSVHTPGHTPGHLCFWEARTGMMLTGDHVLPRISPNIAVHPHNGDDPLKDYLDSLRSLRAYGDVPALPAHQWRFPSLERRIDELLGHHEDRLQEVEDVLGAGAETIWEITKGLEWSSGWPMMAQIIRRLAMGETHAHLLVLQARGRVTGTGANPIRWRLR